MSDKGEDFPGLMAWMKIAIHDYDGAFEWLNLSLEKREAMIMSLPVFKWWDPIRNDPRFEKMLKKTGLTEYLITYSPVPF